MANSHENTAAAAASTAAVRPLSYVSLRSHDEKRVILPVAAAAGSRVLHGIFQGLYVMQLHQCTSPADQPTHGQGERHPVVEEGVWQGELYTAKPSGGNRSSSSSDVPSKVLNSAAVKMEDSTPVIEDEDDSEEADINLQASDAVYRSYAAVFPSNVACVPPPPLSLPSAPHVAAEPPPCVPPLLDVPIRSLESSTLMRVAEFLVVKTTLASHPHYLHETDVFGDLDRTSEQDQLVAMQVLLGADFLNC
ncbi:hypothetical protein Q4I30_000665 [Leishmania utingensis]|uniref:Uncharacterized protein n=1 Tax=Leishmania utingensis TaxID=653362 RepID=A0AAW3B4M9_9TRYP